MNEFRNLAASVIRVAVEDARAGDAEAREFLTSDRVMFPFWCDVLRVDAARVRRLLTLAL